MPALLNNGLAS